MQLNFNFKPQAKPKEATRVVEPPFQVGEVVTNGTLIGRIEAIGISPYYGETVKRAYVVGLKREFADYWLV